MSVSTMREISTPFKEATVRRLLAGESLGGIVGGAEHSPQAALSVARRLPRPWRRRDGSRRYLAIPTKTARHRLISSICSTRNFPNTSPAFARASVIALSTMT